MMERETIGVLSIPKILSNEILRLCSDFEKTAKKSSPTISWKKFLNLKMTFQMGEETYGLDLTKISDNVKDFIRELIEVRNSQDSNKKEEFLSKANALPDEFFDQPVGQYEDPNIYPITLYQLNAALTEMLNKEITFNFNHENNNQ